jgi:DNA-binding beta-propeller fold protein YncE
MVDEQNYVVMRGGRYRVERFWGTLPEGMSLGLVSTLAVTPDGVVVVAARNGPPITTFDPEGKFIGAWPAASASDPHGVNIAPDGSVVLVDRDAHEVQFATLEGHRSGALGVRHQPRFQAPFNHPTSAFVANDGECYVADGYGNSMVHRFDSNGRHVSSWGRPGEGAGEFSTPHSIWIDRRERVLVADRENNRVQLFSRDGDYIDSWYGFYHPMDISEDEEGYIYVSDQVPRLSQLDSDGQLVGRCRPVWNTPHGIACGPGHVIYLAEMNPSSITKLTLAEPQ